jgi:hypothetical protein
MNTKVEALARLLAKASALPWKLRRNGVIEFADTWDCITPGLSDENRALIVAAVNALPALLAERAALVADARRLREALVATQFGFNHRRCPVCAGFGMSDNGESDSVHRPDCIVGQALAATQENRNG